MLAPQAGSGPPPMILQFLIAALMSIFGFGLFLGILNEGLLRGQICPAGSSLSGADGSGYSTGYPFSYTQHTAGDGYPSGYVHPAKTLCSTSSNAGSQLSSSAANDAKLSVAGYKAFSSRGIYANFRGIIELVGLVAGVAILGILWWIFRTSPSKNRLG